MVVAPPPRIDAMANTLREKLESCGVTVVVSQEDRLEILSPGVDKSWGLKSLADHLTVAQDHVWAVGDNRNDCEMLTWAGRGFAMGQAPESVQHCADHVLPSIDNAGLSQLVDYLDKSYI